MRTTVEEKTCTRCGEAKALDAFRRDKNRRDSLNPQCRDCGRAYYLRSRERILQKRAEYREANRATLAANQAAYRASHPEAFRRWYQENPGRVWVNVYRDRCRRLGIEPAIEDFTKDDVVAAYGDHCAYCATGEFEHLDHYVPVSKGGHHTLANVRPSCAACNKSKADKMPERWSA